MAEIIQTIGTGPAVNVANPKITIIICAHNPNETRLGRVLCALAEQQRAPAFDLLIIDNGSSPPISERILPERLRSCSRIVEEPRLGLTHARARGFRESTGEVLVLVDDDNLLCPDYLRVAVQFLEQHPGIGAIGGPCVPEFEVPPDASLQEFMPLLALRDLGPDVQIAPPFSNGKAIYPPIAPIGAGMVLTRAAVLCWLTRVAQRNAVLPDRRGKDLSSSGDNDIVLCAMAGGYNVAYVPGLQVTHLIPLSRLSAEYLGRLNRGIQKSWMEVLTLHGANPWPPISRFGAQLRKIRSWFKTQPWRSEAASIRWLGQCGHFEGRIR